MSSSPEQVELDRILAEEISRAQLLRRLGVGGAMLALPGFLAAGSSAATNGAGVLSRLAAADTLTVAVPSTFEKLDPVLYTPSGKSTGYVEALALEGLVRLDVDGVVRPALAASWTHPDPLTYIFKLRSGVTWWDGSPLTADDVLFSIERNRAPSAWGSAHFLSVKSVTATGPSEITFKLKYPDITFLYWRTYVTSWIIQKKFIQQAGTNIGAPGVLTMGTGPYRITEFSPDDHVTLVRNDSYWGPEPQLRQIVFKPIVDPATDLLAAKSGEIDLALYIPLDQVNQWQALSNFNVLFSGGSRTMCLFMNTRLPPFNNIHVRRAFAHCIDRNGLVKALLKGHGKVGRSFAPSSQWPADLLKPAQVDRLYKTLPQYPFDLKKAKAELAQSSVPKGFKTTIQITQARQFTTEVALNLAANLKKIGVTLDVKEITIDQYFTNLTTHSKLALTLWDPSPDFPAPEDNIIPCFTGSLAKDGFYNVANYKNPKFDKALARGLAASTSAKRAAALKEMLTLLGTDVPIVPVFEQDVATALSKKFTTPKWSVWNAFNPWWGGSIKVAP